MFGMIPLPYKLLAGVALMLGVFVFGYMKGSAYAEAELQRFAAKNAQLTMDMEKKNSVISEKVVTQYVDRVNTIREKEYVYRDVAKTVVPSQSVLSNGWVFTHDISATGGDADATRSSDASPSGIKDNEALFTIIGNYSRCMQNAEQLRNLQQWINDNKQSIEELNKKAKK